MSYQKFSKIGNSFESIYFETIVVKNLKSKGDLYELRRNKNRKKFINSI